MKVYLRRFFAWLNLWLHQQAEAARSCRSCDRQVRFFEKTCPHCGAGESTRVPLPAALMVLGLPLFLLMVYFGGKWVLG